MRVFQSLSFSSILLNPTVNCKVSFFFALWNLLHQNSDNEPSSKSVSTEILCVLFTLRDHSPATEKKYKLVELSFQSREWSKKIWFCATTNTAHVQRSYLKVPQLTFAEWRSAFRGQQFFYLRDKTQTKSIRWFFCESKHVLNWHVVNRL